MLNDDAILKKQVLRVKMENGTITDVRGDWTTDPNKQPDPVKLRIVWDAISMWYEGGCVRYMCTECCEPLRNEAEMNAALHHSRIKKTGA